MANKTVKKNFFALKREERIFVDNIVIFQFFYIILNVFTIRSNDWTVIIVICGIPPVSSGINYVMLLFAENEPFFTSDIFDAIKNNIKQSQCSAFCIFLFIKEIIVDIRKN